MSQAAQALLIAAAGAALALALAARRWLNARRPGPQGPPGMATAPGSAGLAGAGPWIQAATLLAADADDLGLVIAVTNGAAWKARVDPDATMGLVLAAVILGAPMAAMLPSGRPVQTDWELITAAADLEGAAAELFKRALDLGREVSDSLDAAVADLERATAVLRAASRENTKEARAGAAAAQEEIAGAQRRIGDCQCALEIIDHLAPALRDALGHLQTVPGDLESTYEAAYNHIRDGGTLPYGGDFLTGVPA